MNREENVNWETNPVKSYLSTWPQSLNLSVPGKNLVASHSENVEVVEVVDSTRSTFISSTFGLSVKRNEHEFISQSDAISFHLLLLELTLLLR